MPFDIVVAVTDEIGATVEQTIRLTPVVVDQTKPTISYYVKDIDATTVFPSDYLDADRYTEYEFWIDVQDNRGILLPDQSSERLIGR